jgi:hypothetical protein
MLVTKIRGRVNELILFAVTYLTALRVGLGYKGNARLDQVVEVLYRIRLLGGVTHHIAVRRAVPLPRSGALVSASHPGLRQHHTCPFRVIHHAFTLCFV